MNNSESFKKKWEAKVGSYFLSLLLFWILVFLKIIFNIVQSKKIIKSSLYYSLFPTVKLKNKMN